MSRLTKKADTRQGTTIGIPKAISCYWKLKELEDIEDELGMDLQIFIKCLALLDENKFTYVYYANKEKEWICSALTPVSFVVDMKNKMFIETRRPKGYEQKLKFADYGIKWALTKKELQ